jgi:hypothetical protein
MMKVRRWHFQMQIFRNAFYPKRKCDKVAFTNVSKVKNQAILQWYFFQKCQRTHETAPTEFGTSVAFILIFFLNNIEHLN